MEHGKRRRLFANSEPYEPVLQAAHARNGADRGMPGVVTRAKDNSQPPLEQHDETAPLFQAGQAHGSTDHVMTPVWHLEDSQSSLQRQGAVPNLEASVDTDETFNATVKVAEWLERAGFCNVPASDTVGNRSLAIAEEVCTNVGHVPTWSADPRLVDGFRALVRQEVSILEDRLDKLCSELEKRSAERNEKIARMLDGIKCVLAEGDAEIRKVRIAMGLPSAEDVSDPAGQ